MNNPVAPTRITLPEPVTPRRRWWHEIPMAVFYVPVFLAVLVMMLRHRSITAPLRANWALKHGGLFPESKHGFAERFPEGCSLLPKEELLDGALDTNAALARFNDFRQSIGEGEMIVVKPDDGIQGREVHFVRDSLEFQTFWQSHGMNHADWLLQEYVDGVEAAVFYMQHGPDRPGQIMSMTWKLGFDVTGDGHSTIDGLIAARPSDDATRKRIAKYNRERLWEVPAAGATIELMPVRNHHLGATFQDISDWITPEMEAAICPVLDSIDGFNYGRMDIRAPSLDELSAGRKIRILETNALYSEPVHAYDPKYGLWDAYRIFIGSWGMAFRIGVAQSARNPEINSN